MHLLALHQPRPGVPVPSRELTSEWASSSRPTFADDLRFAAAWGADEQLRLCVEWLLTHGDGFAAELGRELQAAMRPRSPSQKEQALKALDHLLAASKSQLGGETIRRALEALPDD